MKLSSDGLVQLEFGVDNPIPYPLQDVQALLELTFLGLSAAIADVKLSAGSGTSEIWVITLHLNDPDATIARIRRAISEARSNLGISAERRNHDRLAHIVYQLRSGRHKDVIGQAETSSLEFKSFVDLESAAARIELAQDVARFANSERPGLLVVGYRTVRKDGEDVASKLSALPAAEHTPSRYESIIDDRVYPSVRGLTVERVAVGSDSCLIVIYIPAQREIDKPFLVHGAVVEGKVEGTFFSIVRRRGDGSVPITAREIHAYLSVGRRLQL